MTDSDSDSSYFPPELVLEILLKLPAKSLLRFTLVSKSWHALITSSPFISTHLTQTPRINTLLVRRYISTHNKEHYSLFQDSKKTLFCLNFTSELNFPFNCQLGYFRIIGSCNGILCLCDDLFGQLRNLVLWNPCIQKFVTLPLPEIKPEEPHMFVLGFGCDLVENSDYKLVRVVYVKNEDDVYNVPPEVEVYSSKRGIWRRVMGVEIKHCIMEFMWCQVWLNGVVHWIAYDVVANGGGIRNLVMSFSVADEVFGEIMLPDDLVSEIAMNLGVTVFEGSLAVVKYERGLDGGGSCEVWVMKSYGVVESWNRLYRINLVAGMEKVVGFRNNREVLFSTRRNELVSYDPSSGQTKDLGIRGSSRSFYVQNYVESLVLLKGNTVVSDGFLEGMGRLWNYE
ncbi:unnamed protein product [Withania somnifera]